MVYKDVRLSYQVGEGEGRYQEEAGEAGRQAGLQLPQLSQFLNQFGIPRLFLDF